jgi:CRP-like cAMP-binding protein
VSYACRAFVFKSKLNNLDIFGEEAVDYQTVIGVTALIVTAATAVITVTLARQNVRQLQEHHSKLSAELADHFSNQKTIVGEYFKMLERILIKKQRRGTAK